MSRIPSILAALRSWRDSPEPRTMASFPAFPSSWSASSASAHRWANNSSGGGTADVATGNRNYDNPASTNGSIEVGMTCSSSGGGSGGGAALATGNRNYDNPSSTNNNIDIGMTRSDFGPSKKETKSSGRSRPLFPLDTDQKQEIRALREEFRKASKVREYSGHTCKVHSVDWSCDGKKLASGSFDQTVCVFMLENSKLRLDQTFKGHTHSVDQLKWHPSHPEVLATTSGDKTVKLWDARQPQSTSSFSTKGENININWSPDANYIAVGNKDDLLTFLDLRGGPLREEPFKFEVNEMTWDPTNKFFFLTNGNGNVLVYNWPGFEVIHVVKAHTGNCICIEFHPSGDYFAVGAADAIVSLWTADTFACLRSFNRLDWPVRALSFNYNGSMLASASEDLVIDISHTETAEMITQIPVDTPTFTVAFHPSRNISAYACDDKESSYQDRDRDSGLVKIFGLPSE